MPISKAQLEDWREILTCPHEAIHANKLMALLLAYGLPEWLALYIINSMAMEDTCQGIMMIIQKGMRPPATRKDKDKRKTEEDRLRRVEEAF